jgi:hypothetical protein
MGLDDSTLGDSSVAVAERSKIAELKLQQYFDRLIGGKIRLRPIPSPLATLLRERSSYKVNDAGLNRAIELAQASVRTADSARAGQGPLQPAPGPAPIPGVAPDTGKAKPNTGAAPAPGASAAPRAPAAPDTQPPKQGS